MPESPIRKLAPLAYAAQDRGVKIYRLKQKNVKLCRAAAGMNRNAPTAYSASPSRIPFL